MKKIRVKDFKIRAYPTLSRIAGRENEWNWEIITADGKKLIERGFSHKYLAQEWLSRNVKIANQMIEKGMY